MTEKTQQNIVFSRDTRVAMLVTGVLTFACLTLVLFAFDFVPEPRVVASEPVLLAEVMEVSTPAVTLLQDAPINMPVALEKPLAAKVPAQVAVKQPVAVADTSSIPVRIRVGSIGIDAPIITPYSTDIDILDRALLSGAVHYPESAEAGEKGNMLIFGHSSYLPVVKNKAFQAFNELGKLSVGAPITVLSNDYQYTYVVREVRLADAEDTTIWFDADEPTLTLATCNTFGAKQERWVVTATLTSKKSI